MSSWDMDRHWIMVRSYEEWKHVSPEEMKAANLGYSLFLQAMQDQRGIWR